MTKCIYCSKQMAFKNHNYFQQIVNDTNNFLDKKENIKRDEFIKLVNKSSKDNYGGKK